MWKLVPDEMEFHTMPSVLRGPCSVSGGRRGRSAPGTRCHRL